MRSAYAVSDLIRGEHHLTINEVTLRGSCPKVFFNCADNS